MKKCIILLVFLSYIFSFMKGQEKFLNFYFPQYPQSPTSSQFMKYGEIQNNESTGTISPEIQLYEIKTGKLVFPLILKYISGNGIKVNEEASNVGLGWAINLPNIVQSVQDFDDLDRNILRRELLDFSKSSIPIATNWPTQSGPTNYSQSPDYDSYGYFISNMNYVPLNNTFNNQIYDFGVIDMQPDIFTLNLFGEKIDFIISNFPNYNLDNNTLSFLTLNKSGYSIKRENGGFVVKDKLGNNYVFDKVEKIEAIRTQGKNYLLSEVSDINNNKIQIEYENINNVNNLGNISSSLNYNFSGTPGGLDFGGQLPDSFDYQTADSPLRINFPGKFILNFQNNSTTQNYLQLLRISFNNGTIDFTTSDREDYPTKKIDKISIRDKRLIEIKNIIFEYDYFLSNNFINNYSMPSTIQDNRLKKRLKLKSVTKSGENPYIFEYNNIKLPPKNSYAVDYWGYYNGGFNNKTFILNPTDFNYNINIPLDSNYNENKKNADINYAVANILQKITYPTKGYSLLEYEMNESDNMFSIYDSYKLNQGNGLRIKKQKNYNFNNDELSHTDYEYFFGKTPSPTQLFKKDYIKTFKRKDGSVMGYQGAKSHFVYMMSGSINSKYPLSTPPYTFYEKVVKKEFDNNNQSKGKIESYFSNNADINYYLMENVRQIFLPSVKGNKIENGTLLKKIIYNSENDTIQYQKNDYFIKTSLFKYGVSKNLDFCYNLTLAYPADVLLYSTSHSFGFYPIYSNEILLKKTQLIEYYNNNKLFTTTDFVYNLYGDPLTETTIFPDGKQLIKNSRYALEENNQKLRQLNMVGIPIRKSITDNINNYEEYILNKFDGINHYNVTSVDNIKRIKNIQNNFTKTVISYNNYDDKGNLLQYTNKSDIPTTIIWGYNQTQPIAKIEGAKYDDVKILQVVLDAIAASNTDALDSTKESDLIAALDKLRDESTLKGYQISTYTYDPLIGVTSITPVNGVREIYQYDSANRLEKVIDINGNILKEYKYHYKQ